MTSKIIVKNLHYCVFETLIIYVFHYNIGICGNYDVECECEVIAQKLETQSQNFSLIFGKSLLSGSIVGDGFDGPSNNSIIWKVNVERIWTFFAPLGDLLE